MPFAIRPNILRMQPYPPGKPIEEVQRELGLTDVVKLASNENPLGPSPLAVQAMVKAARDTNFYPDARGWALKQKLATRFGVSVETVMLGNGSDEIIGVLGSIFLEPGTELLMGDPSFLRYDAAADVNAAKLVKVPLTADWRHDLPAMVRAVTDQTRLVFIANPNNPTGTIVTKKELDSFLGDLPDHVVTVLDEAYAEFVSDSGYPDGIEYVKEGKSVIALRTFSKAYGLAGARVGYGFALSAIVQAYNSARPPFDVNSLAQSGAIAALDDDEHLGATLANNAIGLEQVIREMTVLGFETIASHTNFVCVRLLQDELPVCDALLRQGVIVRPGTPLGMPGFLRVSIGTKSELDRFVTALAQAVLPSRLQSPALQSSVEPLHSKAESSLCTPKP